MREVRRPGLLITTCLIALGLVLFAASRHWPG